MHVVLSPTNKNSITPLLILQWQKCNISHWPESPKWGEDSLAWPTKARNWPQYDIHVCMPYILSSHAARPTRGCLQTSSSSFIYLSVEMSKEIVLREPKAAWSPSLLVHHNTQQKKQQQQQQRRQRETTFLYALLALRGRQQWNRCNCVSSLN